MFYYYYSIWRHHGPFNCSELSVQLEEDNGDEPIEKYTPPRDKDNAAGCCGRIRHWLKQYLFLWLNVLGVIVGFALAFGLRHVDVSEDTIMWLGE